MDVLEVLTLAGAVSDNRHFVTPVAGMGQHISISILVQKVCSAGGTCLAAAKS